MGVRDVRIPFVWKIRIALLSFSVALLLFSAVAFVNTIIIAVTGYQAQQQDTGEEIDQGNVSAKVMRFKDAIAKEMKKQNFDQSWLPVLLAHVQVESGGDAEHTPDIFQASEYARGSNHRNELTTSESIHYGVACMKSAANALSKVAGHKLSARDVGDVNLTSDYYNFSSLAVWMKRNGVKKWTLQNHTDFYHWAASLGSGSGDFNYYKKILKYYDPETGTLGGVVESVSAAAKKAISIALEQRGKPYLWGQTGPNAFDCSGLVIYAFRKAGFVIAGRPTTKTMYAGNSNFARIKKSQIKAGDLVLFNLHGSVDHVGIYMGNNQMINAETDENPLDKQIEIANIGPGSYWAKHLVGYSRVNN
ncbi:MAG: cell wall hydrolase [Neobacillus sp.]|nr:cell wall hydrolase [Neobacillus sp.]